MKLLFITDIAPFPVKGGEKLRTYGLLNIFSDLGYETHAIIGKSQNSAYKEFSRKNIFITEFDFKKNIPRKSFIDYERFFKRNKEFTKVIDSVLSQHKIDVAFIDYHHYGQYISYFKKRNIKVIYGTHNAQATIYRKLPVKSFRGLISNRIGFLIRHLHERLYFNKVDAFITVSDEDKLYHQRFVTKDKIYVIPNFLIEDQYTNHITSDKKKYIIMTGNFRAAQNFIGLDWFLKNVWDEKLQDKTMLKIAGLNSIDAVEILKKRYHSKNIEALGELDDLKPYIAEAEVSIVPLLDGSGTRLKCVESMALKTQIVSTSKGAEGIIQNGSILIADTPEDFKQHIIDVLDKKIDNCELAYHEFMKVYSFEPNKKIFNQIIKDITNK